ncbi:hypothetical protein BU16DRAFT_535738 [Lophium mytilinum]|uniref:Uncharacterized protein n=1 Tax=Lophium mytilinum TaxID=390894 RepID=A0A6A6R4S1_9PEZI|nr:hypothetical protein BU16DRAFT_535738 [Lophium mytilinum]
MPFPWTQVILEELMGLISLYTKKSDALRSNALATHDPRELALLEKETFVCDQRVSEIKVLKKEYEACIFYEEARWSEIFKCSDQVKEKEIEKKKPSSTVGFSELMGIRKEGKEISKEEKHRLRTDVYKLRERMLVEFRKLDPVVASRKEIEAKVEMMRGEPVLRP